LGTIGVSVEIMRKGTKLPHEISIYSEEELRIRAEQNAAPEETEAEAVEEVASTEVKK
jgi:ribosomal protein S3